MKFIGSIVIISFATTACTHPMQEGELASSPPAEAMSEPDHDRLTFVQAACGGCHAVESPDLSPNPVSPSFADIANREGLTKATLVTWLTDAHNYPELMDFDLDPPQVESVADHILTLRSDTYVRPKD